MAQGNKFGTFGGVFTPAILTILGVIMYLRLPRIVGEAGLWLTIGIVLAAHVISVTTGLSVASIATDKKVKGGGPYYIVSRSLGLPIGGTLGLALYIGLSFSVSLYVIGFCESMLTYTGYEMSKDNIRIAGTLTLLGVTAVTLISTAFAIKIQYFIMVAIGLSLISILASTPETAPIAAHLDPVEGGASIAVLFGIFFPAVTGFTAGVNMSGDLKDPKKALPSGTLAAIFLGLIVYVGLAVFFAVRFTAPELADPEVLTKTAWIPEFVVAGVWGATLSSAIGSILGAPRILQAKSIDRITPEIFARGRGKSNEPINALLLTFGIAEAGILIGELDVIASVVSMFFIMTYGFLNIACAVESWASPDFRPDFKIPRAVPVIGAVTCLLIMIQLDFLAMIAATAILTAIFLYFKRRELTLESGDTWEGVWSSVVRSGLARLSRGDTHRRNWRPNVVAFGGTAMPGAATPSLVSEVSRAVVASRGVLTEFELTQPQQKRELPTATDIDLAAEGIFQRAIPTEDPFETIAAVCRYHGFSGLEPNTVALPLAAAAADPAKFAALWKGLADLDFNVLVAGPQAQAALPVAKEPGSTDTGIGTGRLDFWWADARGNVGFGIALARFISVSERWRQAEFRFLLVTDNRARGDVLYKATQRLLAEARITATVKVLSSQDADVTLAFEELVRQESHDAALAVIGLPKSLSEQDVAEATALAEGLDGTLFMAASTLFDETAFERRANVAELDVVEAEQPVDDLRPLSTPTHDVLAPHSIAFDDGIAALADAFNARGLNYAVAADTRLLEQTIALLDKHMPQILKAFSGPAAKQRKLAGRATGALIFQAHRLLQSFAGDDIDQLRDGIDHGVEALQKGIESLKTSLPREVQVHAPVTDFATEPGDSPELRRLKWRRRVGAKLRRSDVRYTVRVSALATYYLDDGLVCLAERAAGTCAARHYEVTRAVAGAMNAARQAMDQATRRIGEADADPTGLITQEHTRLTDLLRRELEIGRQTASRMRAGMLARARSIANALIADLDRIDVNRVLRKERTLSREAVSAALVLPDIAERWSNNARLRVRRGELQLAVAGFQHRLKSIVERAIRSIGSELSRGVLADYDSLLEALGRYKDAIATHTTAGLGDSTTPTLKATTDFRRRFDPAKVVTELNAEVQAALAQLPERVITLGDEEVAGLADAPLSEPEVLDVALRRMLEVLLETELIGRLQEESASVPEVEHRAVGIAQDAVRLIAFHSASDLESDAAAEVALGDDLSTVVETSLERARTQRERLVGQGPSLQTLLSKQLKTVLERSHSYAITGGADGQFVVQRPSGENVLSGVGRATRLLKERTKQLVYRQSAGVLYRRNAGTVHARRIRDERVNSTIIDPLLELVGEQTPPPELLGRLPFYYRQLFLGKAAVGSDFWVGREAEMAAFKRAVEHYRRGYRGAVMVIGERGSGKSALCQYMTHRLFDRERVHHVFAPPGGSTSVATLTQRLEAELKVTGTLDEMFSALPQGTVVVIHDIELWWERSADGTVVVEKLLALVQQHAERCLFVFNTNAYTYRYLNRLLRLSDRSLATIACQPLLAEELKDVVMQRHSSTGLKFEVGGRHQNELSDLRLARLFTRYYDVSRGNVGAALQAWLAHTDGVDSDTLSMRSPTAPLLDPFDALTDAYRTLVVQFVLHKQLTLTRLARLTQLPPDILAEDVASLERMGILTRSGEGVLELNRWSQHLLTSYLAEHGVIA